MEKTLTEAAQLLQKISKGAAMRRDWEKRCSASSEEESQVRVLAGIFRKETLVHLGMFHYDNKLGAKWAEVVQLMQKFVP